MDINTQKVQKEFRENIINLFQIDKLPEDKQEETINRIGKLIFQAVLLRVLPLMEEAEVEEYNKLIEGGATPEAVLDFFFGKVPGFLDIIAEETENFRKESAQALG
ncbi:hypothetical protein A3D42_02565 [Candidatus Nomurabacteria bacterium RIFCSPHIGHO2_02_FULL_41_18]|uniref:Uncharacterized protein n=1 Tax=Candidatus Nomurabacteria bacterium RIFCSPHIGHO2_02_FULL_41_18 TaxID=1801754 RepID=A0A1F6W4X8_9BACT|nr:MAG: hypothetical protein A2737_01040 [Candidatus Nomurabacteria bacterium RIFCSPHIGHO2_01_FULL_41_71]OGI76988.1 MAG: hypothetical protein A3D42_02565 [Candidatus Nomurabacteria bacterium RIFCSPHIGHO2_02_FULL_41_18]OGI89829.1 MAG: hypothetical protein A3B01_03480 [Candidatus Nomurabacteria bacterium RIFCSPLOWO2_01_FULL_41_52b]OGJ00054.1 MAG: hypothetical protein A3I90_02775 [Candidatus Nomurabacteria bacterium RIFCSPLOWO2_02_FULL_41_9]